MFKNFAFLLHTSIKPLFYLRICNIRARTHSYMKDINMQKNRIKIQSSELFVCFCLHSDD